MLDVVTKRRIDAARDILVGKVPDPKSQVEQITIALIYKFMDDIDSESEELGGKREFFAGQFAKYRWPNLVGPGVGGYDALNLYAEAISRMQENPGIPQLFRNIFNNAYLPYRDPETLRSFLKIIDEFTYDDSEALGDAFEYLLSVLDSQGDAGQFRTPRHIIDFIVAIVDPKKDEVILDPACGTAGFLISSYKHILATNTIEDGRSALTPDERGRLVNNFNGYDISPDFVRLSLVNLYLHGFREPNIHEYDTLTSEDRWNEFADVILANPPFMSPKGGIRPHNRFSIKSKRSEVLFVDYMAEHLTANGRAGIIVPEGIIFQSQKAHRGLRKMLVENNLVAVISLPAGVFNPYSGVKTSILILDRALAKRTDSIAFFRVQNDGFDLGTQRRPVDNSDLPDVQDEIIDYLNSIRADESGRAASTGKSSIADRNVSYATREMTTGLVVEKSKIAGDGDYSLIGERHRETQTTTGKWPLASIGDVAIEIKSGFACGKATTESTGVPHIRPMNVTEGGAFTWDGMKTIPREAFRGKEHYKLTLGDVLFNNTNSEELVGKTCIVTQDIAGGFSNHITRIRVKENICISPFLAISLHSAWRRGAFLERSTRWIGQAGINVSSLSTFRIPLPPLNVQHDIVAEVEGYQKVIDGARAVVENYLPHIEVDAAWPLVKLGEAGTFRIESGGTPKSTVDEYWDGGVPWITLVDLPSDEAVSEITSTERTISEEGVQKSSAKILPANSVVVSSRATIGRIGINRIPLATNQGFKNVVIEDASRAMPEYVAHALRPLVPVMNTQASGATYKEISKSRFSQLRIPLPPLETQESIVAEIKSEQAVVDANRELIGRFEKKIEAAIARVWESA